MSETSDRSHLLLPIFLAAALLLAVVPWLHPVGTCTHWLEKWGEASEHARWVRIHELAMVGFALAGAAAIFLAGVIAKSAATLAASSLMSGGFIIASLTSLIHATSVSTLGRAYRAATDPAERKMLYTVAEALVSYDVASTSASSAMISAGAFTLTLVLFRRRVISLIPCVLLAGLSLVWASQYHGVFNRLGFSVPETIHWASLSLWLATTGLVMFWTSRPRASASTGRQPIVPTAPSAATAD